jgi:hypothetical protein
VVLTRRFSPNVLPLPQILQNMSFLTFLFVATVLAVTPGPGIADVVARTVAGGAEKASPCRAWAPTWRWRGVRPDPSPQLERHASA